MCVCVCVWGGVVVLWTCIVYSLVRDNVAMGVFVHRSGSCFLPAVESVRKDFSTERLFGGKGECGEGSGVEWRTAAPNR